jgi:hypothetical protein
MQEKSNIVPFAAIPPKKRNKGKTLCKNGFHKWVLDKATSFDVNEGKLINRYRCSRCGLVKTNKT